MLIDSDVLIWMTRGHPGATARLQTLLPWRISALTYMELAQGCRNQAELERLKQGLALAQTDILPVNQDISVRAMQLIDTYALSQGLRSADALIAATALIHNLTLLTANRKHFAAITPLAIEVFVP